jgi:hypothetical protein
MMTHYLLTAAAYIGLSILVAHLGRRRKWGYWGYLWASILFTPALGFLFILASDPAPRRASGELVTKREIK